MKPKNQTNLTKERTRLIQLQADLKELELKKLQTKIEDDNEKLQLVTDPTVINILDMLNGKTYKQADDLLCEVIYILEELRDQKILQTKQVVSDLKKFNGDTGS